MVSCFQSNISYELKKRKKKSIFLDFFPALVLLKLKINTAIQCQNFSGKFSLNVTLFLLDFKSLEKFKKKKKMRWQKKKKKKANRKQKTNKQKNKETQNKTQIIPQNEF